MRKGLLYLALYCWLVFFFMAAMTSCKKEAGPQVPAIEVITPASHPVISVPDSVYVTAEIFSEITIESIRVVLVNADRISVSLPAMYYPDGPFFRLEQYVTATDRLLPSGEYFILIYATNGKYSKSRYIPLTINEMPREITGYLSIEKAGAFQTRINYLAPGFTPGTIFILPGLVHSSGVDHLHEQLYLVTPEPSKVMAFPLRKPDMAWSVDAVPPYPLFPDIYVDNELVVGTANGDLFVYDHNGGVVISTSREQGRKVGEIAANKDFIVCGMVGINGNEHFLYTYYRATGGLHRNRLVNGPVKLIIPHLKTFRAMVFTGQGTEIYSLEPVEGIFTYQNSIQDELIRGFAKINEDKILLNTANSIFLYDYQYNTISLFLETPSRDIIYDPLNSVIYSIGQDKVGLYTYPQGHLIGSHNFQNPGATFHVLYNK